MGKLHRTPITRLCEDEADCGNARVHSTDQGGALAFGSDSILILELDRSPPPQSGTPPPTLLVYIAPTLLHLYCTTEEKEEEKEEEEAAAMEEEGERRSWG